MSLERFSRRMKQRAGRIGREANRVKREVALAIDQALVTSTPVDTGTARSNWIVSLGQATDEIRPPYARTSKGGIGETANARGALAQGKSKISKSREEEAIHITNNIDYIRDLNDGKSPQAPAMFVEDAINTGTQVARGAKIDTSR